LESYRAQKRETMDISLGSADYEIPPIIAGGASFVSEPEPDYLSSILDDFHKLHGRITWQDEDNLKATIRQVHSVVAKDEKYQNAMKNADRDTARDEGKDATERAVQSIMTDDMEFYKEFVDNPSFRACVFDIIFNWTSKTNMAMTSIHAASRKAQIYFTIF